MFEWREVREDDKNRSDGNRGAYDVGMTRRWEVVGWRARRQSGVAKHRNRLEYTRRGLRRLEKATFTGSLARWRKEPQKRQTIPNGAFGIIVKKRGTSHIGTCDTSLE